MQSSEHTPFGPPGVELRPFVDARATQSCPLATLRRLGTRPGLALLESHDQQSGRARFSILVTRALLRLEIRGEQATYSVLDPAARPLLEVLGLRLRTSAAAGDALLVEFPVDPGDPGTPDDERLSAPSVLDAVRALAGLIGDGSDDARFAPGVFGALSYEIVDHFEHLPARKPDPFGEPDASFVLASDMIVFDHARQDAQVITRGLPWERHAAARARHQSHLELLAAPPPAPPPATSPAPAAVRPDMDRITFENGVRFLLERILDGDVFQTVLSRGLELQSAAPSLDVYEDLRRRNPSPYLFHLDLGDGALLGASPETFLAVREGRVEVRPIAGTVPRGLREDGSLDPELDARLAMSLLLDAKEQAEHAMLLDLGRNDVARVSAPGTTRVREQFQVEKYSQVQHLVSCVEGRLRQPFDALHAYRAAVGPGTLTGAPKVRAMELIRQLEPRSRGFYGGACGYLLQDGAFDSCIVIRSLRHKNGVYLARAGAGIVAASKPEREFLETEQKSRAVRLAVAAAEGGLA